MCVLMGVSNKGRPKGRLLFGHRVVSPANAVKEAGELHPGLVEGLQGISYNSIANGHAQLSTHF